MSAAGDPLAMLLDLMRRLRDPEAGCPWDRAQSLASVAPHTIEEAYELEDAITRAEPQAIAEELGDLLFQVVFHAQMAEEQGWFDFAAVAQGISAKLRRRHPHVFGDAAPGDAADLNQRWEQAKRAEREALGRHGVLADIPIALPALTRASKLGKRAAGVGFDWPDASGARRKLDEELGELDASIRAGDQVAMDEELGDLLLSITSLARHHGIDPEQSLRRANRKFERRFMAMEELMKARQIPANTQSPEQWDGLWNEAKLLT